MCIFKVSQNNRCKICKVRKGYRFCLRIGENICWQDCNKIRIKMKCPPECEFVLKQSENFQIKTKANSIVEYQDLLKKQMAKWLDEPQKFLDNESPKKATETTEGKEKIIAFLNRFNTNKYVPLTYLKTILKLDNLKVIDNYEDIAEKYLENIVIQDWEKAIKFQMIPTTENSKYQNECINLLMKNKLIQKITRFEIISSALSEDGKQALVHFEINEKYDLTLKLIGPNWKISEKIFGNPELVNGENNAIQQVAVLLSKNNVSQAFELLKKYSKIYPDSADFEYYWGLYYSFSKNVKKSKKHFYKAALLDPNFFEAKYNYAYILHTEKDVKNAKKIYREILAISPNEPKVLNNLASIYIDENNEKEAKQLLKMCLKINPDFELAKKNFERLK